MTEKTYQHQRNLLAEALWDVLKSVGMLNDEVVPNGPELLMHAKDYVEYRKTRNLPDSETSFKKAWSRGFKKGWDAALEGGNESKG